MLHQIYQDVVFETFDRPVGALVSGGVDSSLMLFFLLKHHSHRLHLFTLASSAKQYRNSMSAIRVIGKCAELTGNHNFQHHVKYVGMQDGENLFEMATDYLGKGEIELVYTGVTKNPPQEVVRSFKSPNSEDAARSPSVTRSPFIGKYYRPWTNLDKSDLARIYQHHGLMEELFPHTRSCEWDDEYSHGADPGLGHCGKCWWCEERYWGFGRL